MRIPSLIATACASLALSISPGLSAEESSSQTAITVPDVLLVVHAGDIQRSMERLRTSIYGDIASLPLFAQAHKEWEAVQEDFFAATGLDFTTTLADLARAELQITTFDWEHEVPAIHLAVDLGNSAAALWPEEAHSGWSVMPAPEHADAAQRSDDDSVEVARFGNLYAARWWNNEDFLRTITSSGEDDLRISWNAEQIRATMQPMYDELPEEMHELMDELYGRWGDGDIRIRFLADGFSEHLRLSGKDLLLGSQELDLAVVDHIPADTLMAVATGVNGPEMRAFIHDTLTRMTANDPDMLAEAEAELGPIYTLLDELHGTSTLALLPPPMGAPFPGIAIQLPWTDVLQEHSQEALAMLGDGITLPAVGAQQRLRIPTPMPLPVPIVAARSETHLLITTVPNHARNWLAGEGGGWTASPLFQHAHAQHNHGKLYLLGASDTPRLITLVRNIYDTFGAFAPSEAQDILEPLLDILASHEGQGYLLAGGTDTRIDMRSKGLVGSMMTLPVVAGLMLPAITSAREQARNLETMNNLRQISMAMFNYTENYGRYPQPPEGVAWPEDPRAITAAIFEELALDQELPWALFRAANDDSPLNAAPRLDVAEIWKHPNLDYAHSFVLDWNAPLASPANRPTFATRYPIDGHNAVVVFGDYSAMQVPVDALNEDGSIRQATNPHSNDGDNMFAGDEEHDWSPGARGPRMQAWLR
ncbi:MAG: DUF1559 domain-containing protein [Planctomycetota bacterium]|nr:MAG: DUF1559 domain-containing protein [Planctomycetota bacterium]